MACVALALRFIADVYFRFHTFLLHNSLYRPLNVHSESNKRTVQRGSLSIVAPILFFLVFSPNAFAQNADGAYSECQNTKSAALASLKSSPGVYPDSVSVYCSSYLHNCASTGLGGQSLRYNYRSTYNGYYHVNQLWSCHIATLPCPEGTTLEADGTCGLREEKNLGCSDDDSAIGNPCNAATGNKYESVQDTVGGQGVPGFARHYSSLMAYNTMPALGARWTSAVQRRLELRFPYWHSTEPNGISVRYADGRSEPFYRDASGTWRADADSRVSLVAEASGYTLTYPNGTTERYGSNGHWLSETDRSGNTTSYAYDGEGRLTSVTGPFGHTLTVSPDSSGRISSLADAAGRVHSYSYDSNNNLVSVTYPDHSTTLYHYENASFANHLTGISYREPDGNTVRYSTYSYDAAGKAISTEHAGGMERFGLSYDSGSQTTVTDAANTRAVMTFQGNLGLRALLSKTNQSDGKSLAQTFDASNNLTCRKDEEGRVVSYTYNSANQRISATEGRIGDCANPIATSATRTTTYQYLSATLDLPTQIQSPSVYGGANKTTSITYNTSNLPSVITQSGFTAAGAAVSRTVALGYNGRGQVTSIDGPRTDIADVTSLAYYECTTGGACGQLQSATNAVGHVTTYDSYDANGRLLQMTDPNGLRTNYTYDPRGRVATITQTPPGGGAQVTQYTYNAAGNVTSALMPDGTSLTYTYDAAQKLRQVTDNLGNSVAYHYDLRGNRTQEATYDASSGLIRQIDTAYDARNRASSVNHAGSITQLIYDALGNLMRETDPNQVAAGSSLATNHAYDSLDRLFQTVNTMNGVTSFAYDVADRLTLVQAPNNATTQYLYDDLGNLLQEVSPDRGTTVYTYDAAGNVRTVTDARGITANYHYDALNRLTAIDYPGTTEDVLYTYDTGNCPLALGRLCRQQDESGVTEYGYDAFGNITQVRKTELGVTYVTSYAYDAGHRITAMTYPDGRTVGIGRNALGQAHSVTAQVNGGPVVLAGNLLYRADGLPRSLTFGNNFTETRTHDLQGRLLTQTRPDAPIAPPAGVDLVTTALSASQASVSAGGTLATSITVQNLGSANVANDVRVRLLLSTDTTFTLDDLSIVMNFLPWLQAGQSTTLAFTPTLPAWLAPGTYYLGAMLDDNNAQPETNETNNVALGPTITVTSASGSSNVDLTVTALSGTPSTAAPGDALNVSVTVQNAGTAPVTTDLRVRVVLSPDTHIAMEDDAAILVEFIPWLSAGQSSTLTFTPTVPTWLPPGSYYLGAIVDDNNQQTESNETNNTRTGNTVQVQ